MCGGSIKIHYHGFRVYLESLSESDAGELARNANDYEIAYNAASIGAFPYPYSIEDAHAFIESAERSLADRTGYHFGVHLSDSGALIGAAGVLSVDSAAKNCSVGYWLGKEHWGKGYAKEAVMLLSAFSFKNADASTVNADVFGFNSRSVSMLGSIGFVRDPSFKEMKAHYAGYAEEFRYSMTKNSFSSSYKDVFDNTVITRMKKSTQQSELASYLRIMR